MNTQQHDGPSVCQQAASPSPEPDGTLPMGSLLSHRFGMVVLGVAVSSLCSFGFFERLFLGALDGLGNSVVSFVLHDGAHLEAVIGVAAAAVRNWLSCSLARLFSCRWPGKWQAALPCSQPCTCHRCIGTAAPCTDQRNPAPRCQTPPGHTGHRSTGSR